MIVYWLLLLVTAFFAYLFGSMDTMVLASNFVFHRNLRRLGDTKTWLSNFKRLYGPAGFLKLLAVELVKDLIPILIGSLLLGVKGHADAGRAFAGFVLVLGRLWKLTGETRWQELSQKQLSFLYTTASGQRSSGQSWKRYMIFPGRSQTLAPSSGTKVAAIPSAARLMAVVRLPVSIRMDGVR